jgi:hypothetical protein
MRAFKIFVLLGVLLPASSAFSHHSSAGINQRGSVTVEGTVKDFHWGNPHSWIELEVVNAQGVTELWNFEMNPPVFLVKQGFTRSSLKPGEKVAVTAKPFFDGRPGGIFRSVTLPDGKILGEQPQ